MRTGLFRRAVEIPVTAVLFVLTERFAGFLESAATVIADPLVIYKFESTGTIVDFTSPTVGSDPEGNPQYTKVIDHSGDDVTMTILEAGPNHFMFVTGDAAVLLANGYVLGNVVLA